MADELFVSIKDMNFLDNKPVVYVLGNDEKQRYEQVTFLELLEYLVQKHIDSDTEGTKHVEQLESYLKQMKNHCNSKLKIMCKDRNKRNMQRKDTNDFIIEPADKISHFIQRDLSELGLDCFDQLEIMVDMGF